MQSAKRTAADGMEALSRFLPTAGLPAEVLQQLQQQLAAVQQQLTTSLQDGKAAGADSDSTAQQLRSFAQAVAGRIPLSTACNNPGCVSLAQRSELLLVGGKSCVCGRCRMAR
jgi:3-deoxy-D-arabino-heptulosonate 7-phosphate (DAHP) synthase class II